MSEPDPPDDSTPSEEAMRWAAEEPTAMWDSSSLETEGFNELLADREQRPREATGPATTQSVGGSAAMSSTVTGGHAAVAAPLAPRKPAKLSWALTFAVALGLGLIVYFAVSALR